MNKINFQRRLLGILCALLVPCCLIFGLFGIGENLPNWWCSVSQTYYANSKMCMIGLLFATAVFFYSYTGYDKVDIVFSIIQATSAIGVVIFPCMTTGVNGKVGLFGLPVNISHIFHCASAMILFLAFATNIMFVFTRGDKTNPKKVLRNKVYRICASVIYLCAVVQMIVSVFIKLPDWFPMTMINEFFMLEAFAFAWLTKSGMFKKLNDEV